MAGEFEKAVADFALEVEDANERILKQTVIQLFGDIIRTSPVGRKAGDNINGSGRFRANWFLGGIVASNLETRATDVSGNATVNKMSAGVNAVPGIPEEFSLTNNLPYSEVIEFGEYPNPVKRGTKISKKGVKPAVYEKRSEGGFSKQAPQGVVRTNVTRFEGLLEEQARKEGYGSI